MNQAISEQKKALNWKKIRLFKKLNYATQELRGFYIYKLKMSK